MDGYSCEDSNKTCENNKEMLYDTYSHQGEVNKLSAKKPPSCSSDRKRAERISSLIK